MLRMQLLSDFLRQLLRQGKIDDKNYTAIHEKGNRAINSRLPNPFEYVISLLEELGLTGTKFDLETAVAHSSVISYLQIGRPETILIDIPERASLQMEKIGQLEQGELE